MTEVNHRCAVLGKPIAHSLSPVLHNAAYHALHLDDWSYDKHEVGEPDLEGFLESLDPTWSGLSLTMPLKKTIQPYGTPCNTWAKELMVANTAVFDWTKTCVNGNSNIPFIRLYNTDVRGIELAFEHSYQTRAITPKTDRSGTAVIIGNGNTATSALAACVEMSAMDMSSLWLAILRRTPISSHLPNGICHRNSRSALSAWTTPSKRCARLMWR